MSARELPGAVATEATTGSDDLGNEADSPQQLGKRSSSETQDVQPAIKRKRLLKKDIKSQIKRKSVIWKKKTILFGKKKTNTLSEKEHSDAEENTSENDVCLSVKPMEIDCQRSGESISDILEEKQTNPLPKISEMQVTELDIISKDDSKEDISPCHEDKTLCNINYCHNKEDNPNNNTEIASESLSEHPINSFSKDLTDESNKVSTDTKLQEKTTPKENVFENITKTGNINDCLQVTSKTEEKAVFDNAQTQTGISSELILLNKDKVEFKESVCDNTSKAKNVTDLVEESEVVTNKNEEFKIPDEAETQDGMSSEQILSTEGKMEFKETVSENTMESVNIKDLVGARELDTKENKGLKMTDEAQTQAGMNSEPIHPELNKPEPKKTVCEDTIKTENIDDCHEKKTFCTKGNELKTSDEGQTQVGMSSEQSLSNEDKMELKETDCDDIMVTKSVNYLVEESELVPHGNEELKMLDESQSQLGMGSEPNHSNEDKMEFKETDCDGIMVTRNVNDLVEERELIANRNEESKIIDEGQTKAEMSSESIHLDINKKEPKETVFEDTIKTENISDCHVKRDLGTKENELPISDESQTQVGISTEESLPNEDKMDINETDCDNIIVNGNVNDLVKERELVTHGNEELKITDKVQTEAEMSSQSNHSDINKTEPKETVYEDSVTTENIADCHEERVLGSKGNGLQISDEIQTQDKMSSEQSLSNEDKMDIKETDCDNIMVTGNVNDVVAEKDLITNRNEELKITGEAQYEPGMSSEPIHLDINETEPIVTVCEDTIKTKNISDCHVKRDLDIKGNEVQISDESQTQVGISTEESLSNKDKMDISETDCDNIMVTGNVNDLVKERELITHGNEELKITDKAQTEAEMSSEPIQPLINKTEPKETVCEDSIKTENIADCHEEIELGLKGNELHISDESQPLDKISSEQSLSNEDKMDIKETDFDNIMVTGNVNDVVAEKDLITNRNEELKITGEAQSEPGMSSEPIHLDINKTEPKVTVCEDTINTENIADYHKKIDLGTKGIELQISDESQTQVGMDIKETACDAIMLTGSVNDLVKERELVTHGNEELKITDKAQNEAEMSSQSNHSDINKTEPKETVGEDSIKTENIADCHDQRELGLKENESHISDESQTQDKMSSEQSLSNEDKMDIKETDCNNIILTGNVNDVVEERDLITNINEELKITGEAQSEPGMSSEPIHCDINKTEPKVTVCEDTVQTENISDCHVKRDLDTKGNELQISDESQTQVGISTEVSISNEDKMDINETDCDNIMLTGNVNDLVKERELVKHGNEELKITDKAQSEAETSSQSNHSDINKTEPKETVCVDSIKTKNIADCHEERELGLKGNELHISDESHPQDKMSSEQRLLNEDKMDIKETDFDNIMVTGNVNDVVEEKDLITNRNEELIITGEAQSEPGMSSEPIHLDINKTEPKVTVCEDTIKTENITDYHEKIDLGTKGIELQISDESQTQVGMDIKETDCDAIMITGSVNDFFKERALITHGNEELKITDKAQTEAEMSSEPIQPHINKTEPKETVSEDTIKTENISLFGPKGNELKISDESQTQDKITLEQSLSNEDKMEFKETDCDNIMVTENINDLLEERVLFTSGNEELQISDETQTPAGISSKQFLSVEEKMEQEETVCENTIGTGDINDCQEEMELELVTNQPELMEISDEEDTIKQFNDDTVMRSSHSPEREKYEYKLPAMDDPVWRDRLPPPPGCESPPPYPPPPAPKPVAPPAPPALVPKPTPPSIPPSLAPKLVPPPAPRLQATKPTSSPAPRLQATKPTPPPAPPLAPEPCPPQYNVNSSLDTAKILKSATKNSSGQLEMEFEISHLPKFTVDYVVKKCVRENQIKTVSDATVRTRGQYVAPGSTTTVKNVTGHGRYAFLLCLVINGPSRESLETALLCVKNLIAEGEEAEDVQTIKMFGLPHAPAKFNQNERLMGVGGANLRYIMEQTGAEVTLRGRSSGYLEASGSEAPWPLHIRIRHKSSEGLLQAKDIAMNLILTVTKEFKEFCSPGQQLSVQSAGQVTTGVRSALVPTIVPAPEVTSPHTTPTTSYSTPRSVAGRAFAGSSSTPLVPFTSAIVPRFAVNPLNPLAYFETVGQLANRAVNSSSKVIYESGPQLKNQKPSKTSSNLSTANTSQTPFQFPKPPPPLPRPHPRPTLAVSTSNIQVPPPLRNPPSATPLHLRPSSSSSGSPEVRSSLTFRPQNKKGDSKTEVKKSPKGVLTSQTSKKGDKKPKKIQFSIITATKKNKMVPGNPMIQKKTSFSENRDETGAEKSTTNKTSEAETENPSSLEKKRQKTSRWGQKPDSLPQPSKTKQLLEKLNDEIKNMECGGDKFRLIKIFNLLQIVVPPAHEINDKDSSQLKVIKELLQKTLDYLPSGQLSKIVCEILTALKTEFNILTDENSSEPQNMSSLSSDKTWWQQAVTTDGKAHNEADTRDITRRRETTRRQEPTRRREKESQKSSSTKHYAHTSTSHTSKSHVQESQSRRETNRNSSNKASDLRVSGTSTQEQNQRGGSPKTSSDKKSRNIRESIQSVSSNRKTRSEMYEEKQDPKTLKSEVLSPKPSRSQLSGELNKNMEISSRASTKDQKQGDSLKTFLDKQNRKMTETNQSLSSNRKTSSEIYGENKEPKTLKPEDSSPKPFNSQLSGECNNKTVELTSRASTQEQLGDFLKTSLGSSYRSSSSGMYGEKQEPQTMKSEVLSPNTSKSPLSGELNKIVELLHRALKTATNSLENQHVKLELSKIAQLLEHAIPTGAEVSDEQKSQFLIVLDVLEQTLQRNIPALGQESVHLTSIIALLKNRLRSNYKSVNPCEKDHKKTSLTPSSTMHLTQTSSETRQLPETKVRNELGDQQPDQLSVITHLLQKAIKTFADTLGQGIMKTRLILISQSLEEAASKSGKSTQSEQSNLLTIIQLLEQLLSTNQLLPSHQPKELLSIMQQLKYVLESKAFGGTTNIQHNIVKPVDNMKIPQTNVQTLNTPTNQHQSQLLQIIQLLQKALHSYCTSMEQGYLKSQLTQISQMLDRELQEHVITMSPEKLKKQMSPLIQLLHQLLQNQPTSNQESKQLIEILQHIEKSLNPPVTMNPINSQASNLLGNLQQLQMLQTLQHQMQGGSQLGMGLPFQPMQMQAAPITNNLLQLQLMQVMQQMQAALGSQSQQPANPVSNQLNQLSQQLQTLQQQFTQVSQLNQQQPFQTTTVPQQQALLQSLSAAGPQSFMRPASLTEPQANLSDLMLQIQQASQQFKGSQ